jgi:hypothetical protein
MTERSVLVVPTGTMPGKPTATITVDALALADAAGDPLEWLTEPTDTPPMIVTAEEDRSAIAYLRRHILDLLFERQLGLCFICDKAIPEDYGSMHIHHEPPLSVRMPNGYGPATTVDQLHLTHPKCNLSHKKPRRKRG